MVWLSADCDTPSFAAALVKAALPRHGDESLQIVQVGPRCIYRFRS